MAKEVEAMMIFDNDACVFGNIVEVGVDQNGTVLSTLNITKGHLPPQEAKVIDVLVPYKLNQQ